MTIQSPERRRRLRATGAHAIVALGLAAALSGCVTNRELARTEPDRFPVDYRQRHPIAIREGERTVQLLIGTRRGELNPAQRGQVTAFADAWRQDATGGVIVEIPTGTPNERAAADVLAEIRALLVASGVPADVVVARPYRPADPLKLATVRLIYPRMQAQMTAPCGLWPKDLGPSIDRNYDENRQYWNLGCANQRALAAMVEDPADLVQPRPEAPIYTARRTFVLDKYRKGESPVTIDPNATKGRISDIGQ
jgi:pilus assembly protein CpaD